MFSTLITLRRMSLVMAGRAKCAMVVMSSLPLALTQYDIAAARQPAVWQVTVDDLRIAGTQDQRCMRP